MALTDAELVRHATAGKVRVFDRLVDRYYARCLRFAWRQLGERADAEEAVQEAFLPSYRASGARTPERFTPWTIVVDGESRLTGQIKRSCQPANPAARSCSMVGPMCGRDVQITLPVARS